MYFGETMLAKFGGNARRLNNATVVNCRFSAESMSALFCARRNIGDFISFLRKDLATSTSRAKNDYFLISLISILHRNRAEVQIERYAGFSFSGQNFLPKKRDTAA